MAGADGKDDTFRPQGMDKLTYVINAVQEAKSFVGEAEAAAANSPASNGATAAEAAAAAEGLSEEERAAADVEAALAGAEAAVLNGAGALSAAEIAEFERAGMAGGAPPADALALANDSAIQALIADIDDTLPHLRNLPVQEKLAAAFEDERYKSMLADASGYASDDEAAI